MSSSPVSVAAPPAAPVLRLPSAWPVWGQALLLLVAGLSLRAPGWDVPAFLALNNALCRPDHWCGGLWAGLSVAGLGVSVLILLFAVDRRHHQAVAAALWSVPIGTVLTHLPKNLLGWPRPPVVLAADQFVVVGEPILRSASMPSGHTLTVFTVALILHVTWAASRRTRVAVWAAAVAVAVSRLATGAHWPGDVLAGAGLGLVTGWLSLRLARGGRLAAWLGRPGTGWAMAGFELLLAAVLVFDRTGYPMAAPLQVTLAALALASALAHGLAAWQTGRPAAADATGAMPDPAPEAGREAAGFGHTVSRLAGPALVAGLLASALVADASWQRLGPALAAVPAWVWAAVLAGLWGSYLLRAERMRREWTGWLLGAGRAGVAAPTLAECLSIFLAHNAALVVLPLRAGELGYPWLLRQRWGVPLADSLRSLLWLRFQDAVVLGLAAAVLMLPLGWPARLAALAVAVLAALWGLPWLIRALAQRAAQGRVLLQALHEHARDRTGWWLCAANWLLKLAVLGGLLALLAGLGWNAGWRGAVGGELAAALPLQAPAGLGTYEAGIWGAVALGQVPPAGLVAAALAVHAVGMLCALITFALFRAWPLPARAAVPLSCESSPS